jgi:hypothetical protein
MDSKIFELFEIVSEELCSDNDIVLTARHFQGGTKADTTFLDDLSTECKAVSHDQAIRVAIERVKDHFEKKKIDLPFSFDPVTSRFRATNVAGLAFVTKCSAARTLINRSMEFELLVWERLQHRLKGRIHRVGWPRKKGTRQSTVNAHLKANFGFKEDVLIGRDKDGGFDILWAPPLGALPFRPVVAIQCKNGLFSKKEAASSLEAARTSLNRHIHLHKEAHMNCVVFNDYLEPGVLFPKGAEYTALGLSDLLVDSEQDDFAYL